MHPNSAANSPPSATGEEFATNLPRSRQATVRLLVHGFGRDLGGGIGGYSMAFVVVPPASQLRGAVEHAIRGRYWSDYQAQLCAFPDLLVAEADPSRAIVCAAGIRFGRQPLFAEHYLDLPVELALRREVGQAVDRARVVEVCHLVAARAGRALPFVRRLIAFVRAADAEWAIFTATIPLRHLLRRSGIEMIELADADPERLSNAADWGSYFAHGPKVMAVSRAAVVAPRRPRVVPAGLLVHA